MNHVPIVYESAFSAAGKFDITEHLRKMTQKLEWLEYEVDPDFQGFMEFGPDDIGGVWEKLGVIRRKPKMALMALERRSIEALEKHFEQKIGEALFGIPIVESPVGNFVVKESPFTHFVARPEYGFKVRTGFY